MDMNDNNIDTHSEDILSEDENPTTEAEEIVAAGGGTPTLTVKRNGVETTEVFPVVSPCVIGRFDPSVGPVDVDLGPLPEAIYVSRKHAKLTETDGVWTITDLQSSNGTWILRDDFEKVDSAEITDGTDIALGNAKFVFKISS